MAGVVIRGLLPAARKLERVATFVTRAHAQGLRMEAEKILADVKASRPGHGVPVDTGTLRDSGQVHGPTEDGKVVIGFGGQAQDYALYQHERMDLRHRVGEARYLVRGVERWMANPEAYKAALRANVEAGIKAAAAG